MPAVGHAAVLGLRVRMGREFQGGWCGLPLPVGLRDQLGKVFDAHASVIDVHVCLMILRVDMDLLHVRVGAQACLHYLPTAIASNGAGGYGERDSGVIVMAHHVLRGRVRRVEQNGGYECLKIGDHGTTTDLRRGSRNVYPIHTQPIANTWLGHDALRLTWIALEFLSKTGNMDTQDPVRIFVTRAEHGAQELPGG